MAVTPRELDRVNCILLPDDVLASGPRTPSRRPGPIAATRLLDFEDDEFEPAAENSGRGGATRTAVESDMKKTEGSTVVQ